MRWTTLSLCLSGSVGKRNYIEAWYGDPKEDIMAKNTKTYECPACKRSVTVNVKTTYPPTCSNHTGGGKLMKEK
jgi:ribosomal protein L37AE/L43A